MECFVKEQIGKVKRFCLDLFGAQWGGIVYEYLRGFVIKLMCVAF